MVFDNGQYFSAENSVLHEGGKEKKEEKQKKIPENFDDYLKSLGKGQKIQKINKE